MTPPNSSSVEVTLNDHEERIRGLEKRMTVTEKDVESVKDDLKVIKGNTTWILRIIIGAIVLFIVNYFLKGGGTPPVV